MKLNHKLKMKKNKPILLFILLFLGCFPVFSAYTLTLEDVEFDTTTGTIVRYTNKEQTDIIIPASFNVNGKDVVVTKIGDCAFSLSIYGMSNKLISVSIPKSVTSIGVCAFSDNYLTNVKIPNSVTTIGESAFEDNRLTSVEISNNVTIIREEAFMNNLLTSVVIPKSVTTIEKWAFRENNINAIKLHNSITSIEFGAFYLNKLTSVKIPKNITIIRADVFAWNHLTSIKIPKSVTTIEKDAFSYNDITTLKIPNNVKSIGEGAFSANELTSLKIPKSITIINQNAFAGNGLTSIKIPNSVIVISESAFEGNELTSVEIPHSVTTIGESAFGVNNLKSIEIPSSVTTIGESAFEENQLTTIVIPNGVKTIGEMAFIENHLTSVEISNSVTLIGSAAFNDNAITKVNGKPSNGIIYARKKDGSEDSTHIVSYGGVSDTINFIPNNITTIGAYAFFFNGFVSVEIPNSVIYLGRGAFDNNYPLKSITLPTHPDFNSYGWKDDHGNIYSSGTSDTLDWKCYYIPNVYTITYILNGGKNAPDNPTVYDENKGIKTFIDATKNGYTFGGWYNDSDEKVTSIVAGTDKNIELYAKWLKSSTVNTDSEFQK